MAVGTITGDQVRNGSLSGRDVRDGSLAARDLGRMQPPSVTVRRGAEGHLDCPVGCQGTHSVTAQAVSCRKREVAVGGGVTLPAEAGTGAITDSRPIYDGAKSDPTGWSGSGWVEIATTDSTSVPHPQAWVLCARAH
jgi:hypothetical protein